MDNSDIANQFLSSLLNDNEDCKIQKSNEHEKQKSVENDENRQRIVCSDDADCSDGASDSNVSQQSSTPSMQFMMFKCQTISN